MALYLGLLLLFVKPLGWYMARVFQGESCGLNALLGPLERGPLGQTSLTVYSVCGPADTNDYEFVLRLNNDLPYVGISIRDVNGQAMFIMTRTFDRASLRSTEIRGTVYEIARRSDWVEEQLTKMDLY